MDWRRAAVPDFGLALVLTIVGFATNSRSKLCVRFLWKPAATVTSHDLVRSLWHGEANLPNRCPNAMLLEPLVLIRPGRQHLRPIVVPETSCCTADEQS